MSDQACNAAPRRLASTAVLAYFLAFAGNLGWQLTLGPNAARMVDIYSHSVVATSILGSLAGSMALVYGLVYGVVQGWAQRRKAAQAPAALPAALQFFGVFFAASLVLVLLVSSLTLWAVISVTHSIGLSPVSAAFGLIMSAVGIADLTATTLLACALASWLAGKRRQTAGGEAGGASLTSSFRAPALHDPGSTAAMICALASYSLAVRMENTLLDFTPVASTQAMAVAIALGYILLPAIPAWLSYLGARSALARRMDRALPLRAAVTGVCAMAAAAALVFAVHSSLIRTAADSLWVFGVLVLLAVLLLLYLAAAFLFSKGFGYLFYGAAMRVQAPAAGSAPGAR